MLVSRSVGFRSGYPARVEPRMMMARLQALPTALQVIGQTRGISKRDIHKKNHTLEVQDIDSILTD